MTLNGSQITRLQTTRTGHTQDLNKLFSIYLYNKTRHSYIYILSIAGQTAGPIGLKVLWTLMGGRGGFRLKNSSIFYVF